MNQLQAAIDLLYQAKRWLEKNKIGTGLQVWISNVYLTDLNPLAYESAIRLLEIVAKINKEDMIWSHNNSTSCLLYDTQEELDKWRRGRDQLCLLLESLPKKP